MTSLEMKPCMFHRRGVSKTAGGQSALLLAANGHSEMLITVYESTFAVSRSEASSTLKARTAYTALWAFFGRNWAQAKLSLSRCCTTCLQNSCAVRDGGVGI